MKTKTTLAEFKAMNSVRKKTHFAKECMVLGIYASYSASLHSVSGLSHYYKCMVLFTGLVRYDYECNLCRSGKL